MKVNISRIKMRRNSNREHFSRSLPSKMHSNWISPSLSLFQVTFSSFCSKLLLLREEENHENWMKINKTAAVQVLQAVCLERWRVDGS